IEMKKGSTAFGRPLFHFNSGLALDELRTAGASLGVVGEFDNSGTTLDQAFPVTPSWTNARPRVWSFAKRRIRRGPRRTISPARHLPAIILSAIAGISSSHRVSAN